MTQQIICRHKSSKSKTREIDIWTALDTVCHLKSRQEQLEKRGTKANNRIGQREALFLTSSCYCAIEVSFTAHHVLCQAQPNVAHTYQECLVLLCILACIKVFHQAKYDLCTRTIKISKQNRSFKYEGPISKLTNSILHKMQTEVQFNFMLV